MPVLCVFVWLLVQVLTNFIVLVCLNPNLGFPKVCTLRLNVKWLWPLMSIRSEG